MAVKGWGIGGQERGEVGKGGEERDVGGGEERDVGGWGGEMGEGRKERCGR